MLKNGIKTFSYNFNWVSGVALRIIGWIIIIRVGSIIIRRVRRVRSGGNCVQIRRRMCLKQINKIMHTIYQLQ
jgi:hypothetical protein